MGCSTEMICATCRKVYYCGYGSYGNMQVRLSLFPKQDHAEHDLVQHFDEATEVTKDGHLAIEDYFGEPEEKRIFVRDYAKFERVDLTNK
jgi:hypothetical protein